MRAIIFDGAIPKYLLTRSVGSGSTRLLTGKGRCTTFDEVDEPSLPGDRWVKIRTRLGGICGSDLNLVRLSVSPSASPFSSFPFVIGHENVGEVSEIGVHVTKVSPGDRVVANPLLPCRVRGIQPVCAQCATGHPARCENFTEGDLAPGMMLGTTQGLGGSWGEAYVAHEDQLHVVPDELDDRAALMLEPFATVLSPLLAHPPPGDTALIIGAGTIGLLALAAVKAVAPHCQVTVLARHGFQAEHAEQLGASHVVRTSRGTRYFDELSRLSQGKLLKPILGKRIQIGGFDASLVCVGNSPAVDDGLRFTRSGGIVYLLGNVARLPGVDWTPLWMKELTVHGSVCYNEPVHEGSPQKTFAIGMQLMLDGWGDQLRELVTHSFSVDQYDEALSICFGRRRANSVKVAFEFPK